MKNKRYILLVVSVAILVLFPAFANADNNDFSAKLSVSDTLVPVGTTVTSTVSITNLDNTYGADMVVSYNSQVVDSFYLGAGESRIIYHDVLINQDTNVFYTVYASHGPDISTTKSTNIVVVYVEQPATPTPTPYITQNVSNPPPVTETPSLTPTPTPTVEITAEITAEPTFDKRLGWGKPMLRTYNGEEVFDNLFKQRIDDWLGFGKEGNADKSELYTNRRLVFGAFTVLILSVAVFVILAVKRLKNK